VVGSQEFQGNRLPVRGMMKSVPLRGNVWLELSRIAIPGPEPHATAQWY